jgi:lysophospholipase L1-like esterase
MPVGDSITAGYTDNPTWSVPFNYGWRSTLYQALSASFPGLFTFVGASPEPWNGAFGDPTSNPATSHYLSDLGQDNHRGYGGQGTGYVGANITSWVNTDKPDVVLLMLGINDIIAGSSTEPTGTESGLTSIVQKIFDARPGATVIVAQIFSSATDTPAIALYNAFVRNTLVPGFLASGHSIATVDQNATLLNGGANSPALFANGLNHPVASGYARMAAAWYAALEPLLTARRST